MRALVIGAGGREHALAWKLSQSAEIAHIYCIPGNGGTAQLPKCVNVSMTLDDFEGMLRFAQVQGVNLTIIGPELPLARGLGDLFSQAGMAVFAPHREGAQIESSKAWAKQLMLEAGIPTAKFAVFSDVASAQSYLTGRKLPIVIKADGLASGKGVTVAHSLEVAREAIVQVFASHDTVVIEDFLAGEELSVLAVTDGKSIRPLLPARDHKRIGEGDTGANTGGMGAYAPSPLVTPELMTKIQTRILEPTIAALKGRGIDYRGCLYAGLMIDDCGDPSVVEFNCRFGDPETQAILPLLAMPLEELLLACVEGRLAQLPPIPWHSQASVCVIVAARGYPDRPEVGQVVSGVGKAESLGTIVFHSGTRLKNNQLVSSGGRVLGITAVGSDLAEAKKLAYEAIAHIYFDGMQYRRDIAVIA